MLVSHLAALSGTTVAWLHRSSDDIISCLWLLFRVYSCKLCCVGFSPHSTAVPVFLLGSFFVSVSGCDVYVCVQACASVGVGLRHVEIHALVGKKVTSNMGGGSGATTMAHTGDQKDCQNLALYWSIVKVCARSGAYTQIVLYFTLKGLPDLLVFFNSPGQERGKKESHRLQPPLRLY